MPQPRGRRPYFVANPSPSRSRSRAPVRSVGRKTISPTMANLVKSAAMLAIKAYTNYATQKPKPKFMKSTAAKVLTVAKRPTKTYRYNTTSSGIGKFPKKKPVSSTDDYAKYGSEIQVENRGVITSIETAYLGHSTNPYRRIFQSVCRAIVKQLFRQNDLDILDWSQFPNSSDPQTYFIVFRYYVSQTATTTAAISINFPSNSTSYSAIALLLSNALEAGTFASPIIVKEVSLNRGTTSNQTSVVTLHLQEFMLDFDISSKLTVQNRTLAGDLATPDNEDDNAESISNNPLKCRIYHTNLGNGFQEVYKPTTIPGTYVSFVAQPSTGFITGNWLNNPTALTKLPYSSFFKRTTSQATSILHPGQIKTSYITYKRSMYLQTFMNLFQYSVSNDSDVLPLPINFGNAELIGFEKVLQSAGENPINISYEINQKIKCKARYTKNIKSTPIFESNA